MTLKKLRKQAGFTQEECAKFLGVAPRTYQNYEIDDKKVDKRNADRLYDCFLSIHDLQAFCFIMNEYEDFITEEQRAEILEVARQFFDESVWEEYV